MKKTHEQVHTANTCDGVLVCAARAWCGPTDPPGKEPTVWVWIVYLHVDGVQLLSGVAQNQGRARAAIRKFVRTLPDKKKAKA